MQLSRGDGKVRGKPYLVHPTCRLVVPRESPRSLVEIEASEKPFRFLEVADVSRGNVKPSGAPSQLVAITSPRGVEWSCLFEERWCLK